MRCSAGRKRKIEWRAELVGNGLRGVVIGASMLLPGISGGTMAILLGIYDRLVSAVSGLLRHPRQSLFFLATVGIGGLGGMALFSRPLLSLVHAWESPMLFFFMGAVLGGLPLLVRKAEIHRFTPDILLFPLAGLLAAVLLGTVPSNLFQPDPTTLSGCLLLLGAGLLLSVALVLPGISASYLLLVLGLYEPLLTALHQRQLGFLLLLGLGTALGVVCTTRTLERAMTRHPQPTYLVIAGFVVCALGQIWPGVPVGWELLLCLCTLCVGFCLVHGLSRRFSH